MTPGNPIRSLEKLGELLESGGFPREAMQALERAIEENRGIVLYVPAGHARHQFSKTVAKALQRPHLRAKIKAQTTIQDLLMSSPPDVKPRPSPLFWSLNWNSAKRHVEGSRDMSTPAHATDADPSNGVVLMIDEVDKADLGLSQALLDCLNADTIRVQALGESIPLTKPRPLLVFTAQEDCVLPDVFSDCIALHLSSDTKTNTGQPPIEPTVEKIAIPPPTTLSRPPRLDSYPIVGELPRILRKHLGALDEWFERGGDIFEVSLAGLKLLIIARGDLAAEGIINNRTAYVRSPVFTDGMRNVTGNSLLTLDGAAWRERRRALQPKFHTRVILEMVTRIHAAFDGVLETVEPGRVELAKLCDHLTLSVGLKVMFGHTMNRATFEELEILSPIVLSRVAVGWLTSKLPKWLKLPGEAKFCAARDRLDEILLEMVRVRRESGELGDDVLGTLLHMVTEGELDDRGVRDEAVTMLLAGYETTSNSLSWTLHTLASHPDVVEKIRAEANAVLVEGDGDVRKLEYCLHTFKEGLRLHPSVLWFPRLAVKDTTIGEYTIAKGDTIVCSLHLIHRNPQDWPDAGRFDPDRFAGETPRYAFMPFGIGQQMCIGKHLALLEGQLVLAKVCQRWNLSPVDGHQARKRISTTLSNVDGIYVNFEPV